MLNRSFSSSEALFSIFGVAAVLRFDKVHLEELFEGFWCNNDSDDLWWLTPQEKQALPAPKMPCPKHLA